MRWPNHPPSRTFSNFPMESFSPFSSLLFTTTGYKKGKRAECRTGDSKTGRNQNTDGGTDKKEKRTFSVSRYGQTDRQTDRQTWWCLVWIQPGHRNSARKGGKKNPKNDSDFLHVAAAGALALSVPDFACRSLPFVSTNQADIVPHTLPWCVPNVAMDNVVVVL